MNGFRAWDKENNKFFEPTFKAYNGKVEELLFSQSGRLCIRKTGYLIDESCFPDRFIIEWATGIMDKNSKEIYEGDWTKADWGYCGLVDLDGFMYAKLEQTISDNIEVIGNIHEKGEPNGQINRV